MFRVKSFRAMYTQEHYLAREVEDYLNNTVEENKIINIQYFACNNYLYCMIIWEED